MTAPILYWMRRDFRFDDNPALRAAVDSGSPVIPLFLLDEVVETHGAAPKWRLGLAAQHMAQRLSEKGSKLILRRGNALECLQKLISETGAKRVVWNRLYDPDSRKRDTHVKEALRAGGIQADSFNGHLIHEPWTVETGDGGYYKVYTPFWKNVRNKDVTGHSSCVSTLPAPDKWPDTDHLEDWQMGRAMRRGADVVASHINLGEEAARARLDTFIDEKVNDYETARDALPSDGTSKLSENLTYGEISARSCWRAGRQALEDGVSQAETFLKELIWRDFSYHLIYHTPKITTENWRPQWDDFPWRGDSDDAEKWRRGMTGMQVVDAGLREMYVTGTMHNRARMLVASYLTKHLMTHWKIGLNWFEDCLIDWDPAANAMGWQWAAGSGPDAAPFFRIFNPETQADKFDPKGVYRRRWVYPLGPPYEQTAESYYEAIPVSWSLTRETPYPDAPIVSAKQGRTTALDAYQKNRD